MATSLLALLDDIATVLDDVSVMTKVAAKKTAGVLGDDLAVNAEQVSGVSAARELPVVWAVAKGSLVNKAILVPAALILSVLAPWAITPVLMLGGGFLCFEGMEKVAHKLLPNSHADAQAADMEAALLDPAVDLAALEAAKIQGAVRTDFILSAEIIVISLGTVASASLGTQIGVLCAIAAIMTIGVYGLVAGIVKLDDLGLALSQRSGRVLPALGRGILAFAPRLMKFLSIAGTIAMFLVGGGIIAHGIPALHHLQESLQAMVASGLLSTLVGLLYTGAIGVLTGALLIGVLNVGGRFFRSSRQPAD